MILMKNLLRDQGGAAAVQYALVIGVLTFAVLAGSYALRGSLIDLYDGMADRANAALAGEPASGTAPRSEG